MFRSNRIVTHYQYLVVAASPISMGRLMPCFVFSDYVEEQWRMYDVLHQRWLMDEERNGKMSLNWLQDTFSCEALYMGWLLLIDNDHHLSLFHPSTRQRRPLPQDSRRMPTLQDFIFRFASPPPDCHVVAIHKSDGFFFVCRPGVDRRWSSRHRFPVEQDVFDAVLCNGKIYAASKSYVIAIDAASLSSSSTPDITCFPLEYSHANSSLQKNNLVESDGQLYMVWQSTLHPHEFGVCKWAFSSHVWETATSIGNRLFMIGEEYSGSLPAAPDDSTTGMVYFLSHDNEICSFSVNSRSLTTHYHCLYFRDEDCLNWLLIDEEAGDVKIDEHGKHNLLKAYNNVVIRSNPGVARRGADVVTWSPKTPWLMFAKGYDATFKFIDPSSNSNTVYQLHIPELLNKEVCHATDDGWLVVVGDSTMFLFNPFTRVRIDIIPPDDEEDNLVHSKYALSSSPTCQGCLLFSIHSCMIFLFRLNTSSSRAVQKLYYNNDPPTTWPLSNPVYCNGLFYCLDMTGNLGTYDPLTNTWVVIDAHIPFDPTTPVESCFLIKSDSGDLISVFMDRAYNAIGVYILDSVSHRRWREVQDMGEKTLFVGPKACFIATAAKPEMANMICSSKFVGDCGNQLLWHRVGVDVSTYNGPFKRRDRHMQLWFIPKGVGLGYDRATGKNVVPSPFICPTH